MKSFGDKVSYLQGLVDGLDLPDDVKNKILRTVVEILSDLAKSVEDLSNRLDVIQDVTPLHKYNNSYFEYFEYLDSLESSDANATINSGIYRTYLMNEVEKFSPQDLLFEENSETTSNTDMNGILCKNCGKYIDKPYTRGGHIICPSCSFFAVKKDDIDENTFFDGLDEVDSFEKIVSTVQNEGESEGVSNSFWGDRESLLGEDLEESDELVTLDELYAKAESNRLNPEDTREANEVDIHWNKSDKSSPKEPEMNQFDRVLEESLKMEEAQNFHRVDESTSFENDVKKNDSLEKLLGVADGFDDLNTEEKTAITNLHQEDISEDALLENSSELTHINKLDFDTSNDLSYYKNRITLRDIKAKADTISAEFISDVDNLGANTEKAKKFYGTLKKEPLCLDNVKREMDEKVNLNPLEPSNESIGMSAADVERKILPDKAVNVEPVEGVEASAHGSNSEIVDVEITEVVSDSSVQDEEGVDNKNFEVKSPSRKGGDREQSSAGDEKIKELIDIFDSIMDSDAIKSREAEEKNNPTYMGINLLDY